MRQQNSKKSGLLWPWLSGTHFRRKSIKKLALATFGGLGMTSLASATNYSYIGLSSGNWTSTNWSPIGTPAAGDNVTVNDGQTPTFGVGLVSGFNSLNTDQASGLIESGNLSTNQLQIGSLAYAGGGSTYTLNSGALTIANNGSEVIGNLGTGTFTQTGGSDAANIIDLGLATGSSGTFNLSGGTVTASQFNVGGNSAAVGGTGLLNVTGSGSLTVNGTLTLWTAGTSAVTLSGGSITASSLNTVNNPTPSPGTAGCSISQALAGWP